MYRGYLQLGGTELANAERTKAYVDNVMPRFDLANVEDCPGLPAVLGDAPYDSPLQDGAPWIDDSVPGTRDFMGFYPLSVTGIDDSSLRNFYTEHIGDNGTAGTPRHASKEIRVTGLLIGATPLGLDAGRAWLKAAVEGPQCDGDPGQSLCFYAAPPDIQKCYRDYDEDLDERITFGPVLGAQGSIEHTLDNVDANVRATWGFIRTDGAVFRYGARRPLSDDIVDLSPRIISQRTNYLSNPSFADMPGEFWHVVEGEVSFEYGTEDGTGKLSVAPTSPSTTEHNLFGDSSFEHLNPGELGHWATGDFGMLAIEEESAPFGSKVALIEPSDDGLVQAGFIANPAEVAGDYVFSCTISEVAVPMIVQISTRYPDDHPNFPGQYVYLTSGYIQPEDMGLQWNRISYSFELPEDRVGQAITVSIQPTSFLANPIMVDGIKLTEATTSPGLDATYFDGDMPPAPNVIYLWNDDSYLYGSIKVDRSNETHIVASENTNSRFGSSSLSFEMRSDDGASVIVRTVSAIDDTILGSQIYSPSQTWERFQVTSTYGRAIRVEIEAVGRYEIRRALLEAGTILYPYFDGDTDLLAEGVVEGYGTPDLYEVYWLGSPMRSWSRISYVGPLTTEQCSDDTIPWFDLEQGEIARLTLDLEYAPAIPAEEQAEIYERFMLDVTALQGVTVLDEYNFRYASVERVEFMLHAGVGFVFSRTREVIVRQAMNQLPTIPWVDPVVPEPTPALIRDPNCGVIPRPPRPPVPSTMCADLPDEWERYYLDIPAGQVSAWSRTMPTIMLTSGSSVVRAVRVRFYPNPFSWSHQLLDTTEWCSEFILSYLPARTELTMDGPTQVAVASVAGRPESPASHLLFGTDGVPMTWPVLTCGVPYVMSVDVPPDMLDRVSLSLSLTRQE